MPIDWRGIAPEKERGWIVNIQRENQLRLEWFIKNQQRFNELANKERTKEIPQEVKDNFEDEMVESFKHRKFQRRRKFGEPDPLDPRALNNIMLPVDPNDKKMLYRKEVDGRMEYMKKRAKLLPNKRYYFPENVNAYYGWKIFQHKAKNYGLGRCQIIKHSFYRRQGVAGDPDWYREPTTHAYSVCNQ